MATPTKKKIEAYKGNDLSVVWTFTDANDDSAIDINATYDAIDFKVFTFGDEASPEFSDSLAGTMSVTSTNKLSVSITDTEVDDLYGKTLYYKLIVTVGAVEKTFLVGDFKVYDYENGAQTDSGFTLSIDDTTQVTNIQTSGLYAEAVAAVDSDLVSKVADVTKEGIDDAVDGYYKQFLGAFTYSAGSLSLDTALYNDFTAPTITSVSDYVFDIDLSTTITNCMVDRVNLNGYVSEQVAEQFIWGVQVVSNKVRITVNERFLAGSSMKIALQIKVI